jgi:O-antigen/teichoic acid export membrane protein
LPEADPTMSSSEVAAATLDTPIGMPPPAAPEIDRSAERNKRFFWSIVTALLTKPLSFIISLVTVPLFLRYLGSERYGLYTSVGAAAMWLGMTNVGMSLGLVNKLADCYVSGDKDRARRYVSSLMLALPALVVLAMIILTIATPLIPWGKVFPTSTPMAPWATAAKVSHSAGPAAAA